MEKLFSHKYVDPKIERTPNAYFFMFMSKSGMAFHVSNISLSLNHGSQSKEMKEVLVQNI